MCALHGAMLVMRHQRINHRKLTLESMDMWDRALAVLSDQPRRNSAAAPSRTKHHALPLRPYLSRLGTHRGRNQPPMIDFLPRVWDQDRRVKVLV